MRDKKGNVHEPGNARVLTLALFDSHKKFDPNAAEIFFC